MKLRYTPESLCDLQEIKRYIKSELHNPTAASRITKAILDGCAQLKQFPKMGVSIGAKTGYETDLRMLVVESYIALYRIETETLLAVSSTPGRTTSAFCWEKLPLDTPHDWSQGILGSAAIACTSGVLHGLPKRIGSGGSRPTVCTRELYQAAGVRLLSPSLRIFCAALMSRSWSAPHSGHSQSRTLRSLTSLSR